MRSYEILELLRQGVEAKDGCEQAAKAFILLSAMEPTADVCGINAFVFFSEAKTALFQALEAHTAGEGQEWHDVHYPDFDHVPEDPASLCAKAWGYFELYVREVQHLNDLDN